jgi:UDPglucose 6-dehydrogenase
LSYVESCARSIAENIGDKDFTVVIKFTVPAGTSEKVGEIITEALNNRGSKAKFKMVSNPEFLREGSSVSDFMNPDRIVIGTSDKETAEIMAGIYTAFEGKTEVIYCDIKTAEVAKYAANAMLASRISFMNEISRVCQTVGGDVEQVKRILGTDNRIGNKFLNAGLGYGGSCFPKDVKELIHFAESLGVEPRLIKSIHETNEKQKEHFYRMVEAVLAEKKVKKVGVLGIAFKAGTDDIREAPSIFVMDGLLRDGYDVMAYDPEAMDLYRKQSPNNVKLATSAVEVIRGTDAIVIVTEWPEFKEAIEEAATEKNIVVIDGRNMFDVEDLQDLNIEYYSVGRPPVFGKKHEEKN